MKKLISLALAMVLALSLLPVPAGAQTTYTYKPYTYTDEYGDVYTFSAASTGYDLHFTIVDEQRYRNSLVILKPGSTVTAKKGQGGDGFITYAVGDGSIGDVVGARASTAHGLWRKSMTTT